MCAIGPRFWASPGANAVSVNLPSLKPTTATQSHGVNTQPSENRERMRCTFYILQIER